MVPACAWRRSLPPRRSRTQVSQRQFGSCRETALCSRDLPIAWFGPATTESHQSIRPNPSQDSGQVDPEAGRPSALRLVSADVPGDAVGAGVALGVFPCHRGCHPRVDRGRACPQVEIARARVHKERVLVDVDRAEVDRPVARGVLPIRMPQRAVHMDHAAGMGVHTHRVAVEAAYRAAYAGCCRRRPCSVPPPTFRYRAKRTCSPCSS
jgi:hypothetical protein